MPDKITPLDEILKLPYIEMMSIPSYGMVPSVQLDPFPNWYSIEGFNCPMCETEIK